MAEKKKKRKKKNRGIAMFPFRPEPDRNSDFKKLYINKYPQTEIDRSNIVMGQNSSTTMTEIGYIK